MADPLTLLRQYNVSNKLIHEEDGKIIFGEYAWPKNVKTNYVIYGTAKDGAKEYYTLDTLLHFLKNVSLNHANYVRQTANAGVSVVRRPDRKDILQYLNGETQTSASIDKSAPPVVPITLKRSADTRGQDGTKRPRMEATEVQKAKEQFQARLDASKEDAITTENISSLSDKLSVEKIAAIKAKRLAKKKNTIKIGDDDLEPISSELQHMLDYEKEHTTVILSRERVWRNRITILQANGKNFAKTIFPILQSIAARAHGGGHQPTKRPLLPQATPQSVTAVRQIPPQPTTYSRYDQERFEKRKETEGFQIDTMGSYHGMTLKSVTEGSRPQRPSMAPVNLSPRAPPGSRNSIGGGVSPGVPQKRVSRTPIIIIPAATTSLITMFNAKDILEDLKFISSDEKRKAGVRREQAVIIQHRRVGSTLTQPYKVIDDPRHLRPEDWDRVAAVFVQGPTWQFKGWPWGGNPVEIFARIRAFHMKWDEEALDSNVEKWSVTVIQLSKYKRHLDRANLLHFWEILGRNSQGGNPALRR
ncbi:parafibromin-like [Varroa jacobsoni]|uniref:Parafibromin n=1 Tax=Varroa destructor TaxID=109461 RepID=A0A7M7JM91_VARDE|nr:parafibromin-like [Varroa destructor]XP_022686450.1 parafibromin-like [Varroa jacobsoni]